MVSAGCARCCGRNVSPRSVCISTCTASALAAHRNSAGSRPAPSSFQQTQSRELSVHSCASLYTPCDLNLDHLWCTALRSMIPDFNHGRHSSLAPLPNVPLISSISTSTHLILSRFTGAAGALAAAREASAASAGICADPYLCCCPGESFDADAGLVTDSVNGGCEFCCRG